MREPNTDKLNELVGKLVGDLGAAIAGASILLGDRLGLYKAMADGAPVTSSQLAKRTGLHERYVREWLSGQAASGYIDYDPRKNAFSLSLSKPWRLRKRDHQLFLPVHSMWCRPPTSMSPRSPKRSEPARALAGMNIQSAVLGHGALLQAGLQRQSRSKLDSCTPWVRADM
jgi:hypothetical protein